MTIQNNEYAEKIASLLVKEANPAISASTKAIQYARPVAGAYLGYRGMKAVRNMTPKQRLGTAATVWAIAELLANPGMRRAVADTSRAMMRLPKRRRGITKGDLAVAAGLGAAGILAVNKARGFHRRATYGSDQPSYNTAPVYYSQTSY